MRVIRPGNIESKNWLVFEDYALSIDGRYIEEKGGPAPGQEFALHESNLVRIMLGQYCDLNDPDDALSYVRLWGFPVRAVNGSVSVDELLESAASMRFLALVIDCLDNPVSVKNKLTVRGDVLDQLFKQWSKSTGEEIYGKFLAKLPILMSSTIQKLKSGSGENQLDEIERLVADIYYDRAETDNLIIHVEPTADEKKTNFKNFCGFYTTSDTHGFQHDHDAGTYSIRRRQWQDLTSPAKAKEVLLVKEFVRILLYRMVRHIHPVLYWKATNDGQIALLPSLAVSTPWEAMCLQMHNLMCGASHMTFCKNERCRKLLSPGKRRKDHCNSSCRKEHWRQNQKLADKRRTVG